MRPQFVCHQHSLSLSLSHSQPHSPPHSPAHHSHSHPFSYSHSHSHSHFHSHSHSRKSPDVSQLDRRYRYPTMVMPDMNNSAELAGAGFNRTPLTALGQNTRSQLAGMLNRKKVLRSEEGHERDWRGIANLAGVRSYMDDDCNMPMDNVLKIWNEHNPKTAEVGHLEQFLGIIDRWDVRDDIQENLVIDTQRYREKQQQQEAAALRCSPPPKLKCPERNNNNTMGMPVNILSFEDTMCLQRGEPLPYYDACVWFADADIEYAAEILENLESPQFNLKLFSRHRNMLGGVPFEHVEFTEFMTTRCGYLIIVMTQAFLNSPEKIFLVNYTQKFQIETNLRKIIPVLYEDNLKIPPTLAVYTHVKYNKDSIFNVTFWDRLASSMRDINATTSYAETPRIMVSPPPSAPPITDTPTVLKEKPAELVTNQKTLLDKPGAHEANQQSLAKKAEKAQKENQQSSLKTTWKLSNFPKVLSRSKLNMQHAKSCNAINISQEDDRVSTISEKKKSSRIKNKLLNVFSRS